MRIDAAEHCEHCGDGFSGGFPCEPRGERDPRLTLVQDEHRPCAFADDEVALPMAGLAAVFNGLRTIMDRRSILDGVARGSGATRATAFVATRQITPQGLGLLCGPIDEGVDCLAADGPQPRFVPGFQPTLDLFGRPSLGEPSHPRTDVKRPLVRGSLHAA